MVLRYIAPNGARMMGRLTPRRRSRNSIAAWMAAADPGLCSALLRPRESAGPGAAATNRQTQATTSPTPAAVAPPEDPQPE